MKSYSLISSRTGLALTCGLLLSAGIWSTPARADQWDKKTVLTVRDEPIQIRETVLQPGQYVLRLLDSPAERHVVQIFNGDQTHIINTVIAIPATRMQATGHTEFTFWETPPGTAKAMRDWYYPGDTIGNEFPYPKHLQQIALLQPPAPPVSTSTESSVSAESNQTSQAQSESVNRDEQTSQQPTEMAQNTTPPATTETQANPPANTTPSTTSSTNTSSQRELPKTGSSYPLFGLGGALLLGLFAVLRIRARQLG
jgi:LPXTG-motif cell wall-anchored protein